VTLRPFGSLSLVLLLTGCSLVSAPLPTVTHGLSIHGKVRGGQQPVNGAHIYLMAAGTGGYGQPSTSLLDPAITLLSDPIGAYVLTNPDGSFSISGDYICTENTQVYLYALGGNPGNGTNSAAGMLAVLGNCPSATNFALATPFIWVNEVSTVAAAYAMAGFATDATDVSSSGTPLASQGIANAFANAANLADLPTGTSLTTTPNGNGTVPQTTINTLANILASCVNSSDADPAAPCAALFADATSTGAEGGTVATDTATAAIYIAHWPGANVSDLYNNIQAQGNFAPSLPTQPTDFTLALTFTGGGIASTNRMAIDASGNVWSTDNNGYVIELNSLGAPLSTGTGFTNATVTQPSGIAIDSNGNAWASNAGGGNYPAVEFGSGGGSTADLTLDSYPALYSITIDPSGNFLLPSINTTIFRLDPSGSPLGNYTTTHNIDSLAVDFAGHIWTVNDPGTSLSELTTSDGTLVSASVAANDSAPAQVSIGSSGTIWTSDTAGAVGVLNSDGTTDFNVSAPAGANQFAFDGAGSAWVVTNNNVDETTTYHVAVVSSSGILVSGTPGYLQITPQQLSDIEIDGSGNVWLSTSNTLTELIGAAAPVVTPLSAATANGSFATRP